MQDINEAYLILKDIEAREKYDLSTSVLNSNIKLREELLLLKIKLISNKLDTLILNTILLMIFLRNGYVMHVLKHKE